jgi:hypothetical protein
MSLEIVLSLTASAGWVATSFFYWRACKRLDDTEKWYHREAEAHERTRQTLREAAARLRRENRDRYLGIIEEHREA